MNEHVPPTPAPTPQQRWGDYFAGVVINHNTQRRIAVTSQAAIARFIGISAVTIGFWLDRRSLPSRKNALLVAHKFDLPVKEVLEQAGYTYSEEDEQNTILGLIGVLSTLPDVNETQRTILLKALHAASSAPFSTDPSAREWRDLVEDVLIKSFTPLSKAQKIAAMIESWHKERGH